LSQAEAIAELIGAQGRSAAMLAAGHLSGALGQAITPIRKALLNGLAEIEASIDFGDDVEDNLPEIVSRLKTNAAPAIRALLAQGRGGQLFRNGLKLTLAGAPNVGKSSLFNALVGHQRALVSDLAGTTRDYITVETAWDGLTVDLCDTAGLSEFTGDALDMQGQQRSQQCLSQADLILWVRDATCQLPDMAIAKLLPQVAPTNKILLAYNKADLLKNGDVPPLNDLAYEQVLVSATTGLGLAPLKEAILRLALGQNDFTPPEVAPNTRHQRALEQTLAQLDDFFETFAEGHPPDICAIPLAAALKNLDEICGRGAPEEVLDTIFSHFCLGK
ncbi:MAG: tRNA modification GTPase, partial [Candidatus Adiutrix sp.]